MEKLNTKKEYRKRVFELRNEYSEEKIREKSEKIFKKIISMEEFKLAETVMVYVSFEKEIYTHDFIKYCLKIGKNLVTPVCDNETKTLVLAKTQSFPDGFKRTKYGILELPFDQVESIGAEELDLIIMPGLAFTKDGDRLGYGGGYYDKLLNSISERAVTVAPVFQEFVFDRVPTEPHDEKVDIIVTEEETYRVQI